MKIIQYIDKDAFTPKDEWGKLSFQDRASIIEAGVRNGMSSLSDIRQAYNSFAEGGQTNKKRFSSLGDITKDWESDYPIKDVTDIMKQGPYYLYESQFDGIPVEADGRYYVVPNYYNLDDVDENSYRVLDYKSEFRPLLPKRDYIGGDNYRERVVDLIPGLADSVYSKAKAYGADPNVMMRRIMKEGFLDNRAREYNELVNTPNQKDYWNHDNIWNREYNSAGEFGLDWVGRNIQDGLYELRNPGDTWMSAEGVNEKNQTVYPMVANLNTSLEALASDAAWRQGRIEKTKNPPKNELPFYVNASYNLDTEHKDLDNRPYILKTYSFDPYYDAQGKFIHKKDFGGPIVQAANTFGSGRYTDDMIYEGGTLPEVTITQFPYLTEEEERRRRGEIREWDPSYMELVSDKFKDRNRDFVNLIGGLNKTVGTAASIAALATAGGWQTLRLLNKGKRARTALASAINATQNADKYADLAGFVFNPNMAGLIDLAANYLPSGDLLTKSGQLIYGIKNAANAYNIINGNKKSYGGPLVQQANTQYYE